MSMDLQIHLVPLLGLLCRPVLGVARSGSVSVVGDVASPEPPRSNAPMPGGEDCRWCMDCDIGIRMFVWVLVECCLPMVLFRPRPARTCLKACCASPESSSVSSSVLSVEDDWRVKLAFPGVENRLGVFAHSDGIMADCGRRGRESAHGERRPDAEEATEDAKELFELGLDREPVRVSLGFVRDVEENEKGFVVCKTGQSENSAESASLSVRESSMSISDIGSVRPVKPPPA